MKFPFNFVKEILIFDYFITNEIEEDKIECELSFHETYKRFSFIKDFVIEIHSKDITFNSNYGDSLGDTVTCRRKEWKGQYTDEFNKFFNNPQKYYKMYNGFFSRTISQENRYIVFQRQKWKCNFCNDSIKLSKKSTWGCDVGHIDHIHPFTKRKTYDNGMKNINEISNLQALCKNCNLSKKDKMIN